MLQLPLEKGVGSAGIAFSTQKYLEVAFFIRLMQVWKKLGADRQKQLLSDPWIFANWLDSNDESEARQFRHMLLYLLYPDSYERISSRRHKVALAGHFESYTGVEQQLSVDSS